MGKRKEASNSESGDDMPAWMLNQRSESPIPKRHKKEHKHHKHKDRKHKKRQDKRHHKKHHKHQSRHEENSDTDSSSSLTLKTATSSACTSVTTTPRQLPIVAPCIFPEPLPKAAPATPRSLAAMALGCMSPPPPGNRPVPSPSASPRLHPRSLGTAPLSPATAQNKPFIGPALSPLIRPTRPGEGVKEEVPKESEFYKLLSARIPSNSSAAARFRPPALSTNESPTYNQWGEKVNGFIGPLPSPGSTPILSFLSPTQNVPPSPAALPSSTTIPHASASSATPGMSPGSKDTPRRARIVTSSCQSPRTTHTQHEFACRGIAHAHSPMCIYHQPDTRDCDPSHLEI